MVMKHLNAFYLSIRECLLFFMMYISEEFVANQIYLLIHLLNSVLAYFHNRTRICFLFCIRISHVFEFQLKYITRDGSRERGALDHLSFWGPMLV